MNANITSREEEVASLVTLGLSNPEIASRLFVSRRTVSCHIEHILSKLHLTSRTQIAVWFALRKVED